jgi:hypothetical protein
MGPVALDRGPRGSSGGDSCGGDGGDRTHWITAARDARSAAASHRGRLGGAKPQRNGHPDRGSRHDDPGGCLEPRPESLPRFRAAHANSGAVARAVGSAATADSRQLLHQSGPGLQRANIIAADLG